MKQEQEDGGWMHISDMMSTLMMIFLFIAVAYMLDVRKEKSSLA